VKAVQQQLPIGYFDTDEWKEGGSISAAGGTLGIPTARPIPMRQVLLTGCCRARTDRVAEIGAPRRAPTHGASISQGDVDPTNRVEPEKIFRSGQAGTRI
jgi:hypothetical protein